MRWIALIGMGLLLAGTTLVSIGGVPSSAQEATPAPDTAGACPPTTEDENIALVSRWYEDVWNARDLDVVDEILADDYIRYRAGVPFANESGTADDLAFVEALLSEFPDIAFSIEDILADEDKVAVRTIATGTQLGPMVDLGGAPATERTMARENLAIWRIECGELVEQWIVQDNLGMLRQLGVITHEEMADTGEPSLATPTP